jgi:hypothetical protein
MVREILRIGERGVEQDSCDECREAKPLIGSVSRKYDNRHAVLQRQAEKRVDCVAVVRVALQQQHRKLAGRSEPLERCPEPSPVGREAVLG